VNSEISNRTCECGYHFRGTDRLCLKCESEVVPRTKPMSFIKCCDCSEDFDPRLSTDCPRCARWGVDNYSLIG